ncbi:hypothetical protein CXG44_26095, partial [Pseudomonas plecoglossicida]
SSPRFSAYMHRLLGLLRSPIATQGRSYRNCARIEVDRRRCSPSTQPRGGVRGGIIRRDPVASKAAPKLSSALSL